MRARTRLALASTFLVLPLALASCHSVRHDSPVARAALRRPVVFEANTGRFDPRVRYTARGPGYTLFLTDDDAVVVLRSAPEARSPIRFRFNRPGATRAAGRERLVGVANYLVGASPADWLTGIPTFARVEYSQVHPGIDLVFYSRDGTLEFDLVVAPGADPSRASVDVEGADRVELGTSGDLLLHTPDGVLTLRKPVVYQMVGAERREVAADYRLDDEGRHVGFVLGAFDRDAPLVIDPQLLASTFLGGTGNGVDAAAGVALDATGAPYIVGSTETTDFPTGNPLQPGRLGQSDAFVTKLTPDGSQIVYSTYLGGTSYDYGTDIAVLPSGVAYVVGDTVSDDFPVPNAFQPQRGGANDVFVVMLNATGTAVERGTYLGGSGDDMAGGIRLGSGVLDGRLFVFGDTASANFPALNAGTAQFGGSRDAFLAAFGQQTLQAQFSSTAGGVLDERAAGLVPNAVTGELSMVVETPAAAPASAAAGGLSSVLYADSVFASVKWVLLAGWWTPIEEPLQQPQTAPLSSPYVLEGPSAAPPGGGGVGPMFVRPPTGGATSRSLAADLTSGEIQRTALMIAATGCLPVAPATTCSERAVLMFWDDQLAYIGHVNFGGPRRGRSFIITGAATDAEGRIHFIGETSDDALPLVAPVQANYGGSTEGFVLTFDPVSGETSFFSYLGGSSFETMTDIAIDGLGNAWVVGSTQSSNFPSTGSAPQPSLRGRVDAFATRINVTAPTDQDLDGLPTSWESRFGLDPGSALAANGANGDPDGDGLTNAQELSGGTHPRGFHTRYLAEGATSAFFDVRLALVNPNTTAAATNLRFLRTAGTPVVYPLTLEATRRASIDPKTLTGLTQAEFSTVIESDVPIVVDRTMSWDGQGYGSHAETSLGAPSTTWYLAEGATHSGFALFYLLQNPTTTPADVEVRYLRPAPAAPLVKTYQVGANARFNIWVNQADAGLAATDVSAVITSTGGVPIIVERAMYRDAGGQLFGAGHDSAGIQAPATSWFLAEGATGDFFDMFILVANPNGGPASVTARYLLPSGQTLVKTYTVAANARFNIWVDLEDAALANTAVSTTVTADVPIIVERSMWWPSGPGTWAEAHNSAGATATGTRWALAEGEVGGAHDTQTYVLLANTSLHAGSATVTLLYEDGTSAAKNFALAPSSRFNVDVAAEFPGAVGRRFGAVVQSEGAMPAQIVVERAMYSNANGVFWAAGTNALATRLNP